MMIDCYTIYQRVSQFLIKKGYDPILLKSHSNNIEAVLFADYSKKIVFAVSLKHMSDMMYLFEGALFCNTSQKSISCGEWRACSIHCDNNNNIDNLISQFIKGFDEYMSDGDKFISEALEYQSL